MRALLAKGAKVNAKDNDGRTPLHRAAYNDHKDVAALLIANGAQVNAKGEYGCTPLHCAAYYGHEAIVTLLIANGAQVNARSKAGTTPLGVAKNSSRWRNTEAVRALLRKHGGR